jgi:predicted dehydrogenase
MLHDRALAALHDRSAVRAYTRYEEVLADSNVDAVALTVRCQEQGTMAAMALEAGKHCHQEVPAAHTLDDCWRLVVAQERSGKVYLSAEQGRYAGFIEAWSKLSREGSLGKITYAEGQYFHYYVGKCFRDPRTGEPIAPHELQDRPGAERTWMWHMPPIHYLVHSLSPILRVLDDRPAEVIGMCTDAPSDAHPELRWPDMQVALIKTHKGALLRMAVSFAQPHPEAETHWYQVIGTRGAVEWGRTSTDPPKLWLADMQMHDKAPMTWSRRRTDEPAEARGTGHDNLDYYAHAAFRDAVLGVRPLEFDVYKAVDVAAAGILAADSIAADSRKLQVPDFRPGAQRQSGAMPRQRTSRERATS